jgi:hypothetical protein
VKTTAYIAGKMSGIKDFNYPLFHEAAANVRACHPDWKVINPAENFDGDQCLPREDYFRRAYKQVAKSDLIILLKGWEKSPGAISEVWVAYNLGLDFMVYEPMEAGFLAELVPAQVVDGLMPTSTPVYVAPEKVEDFLDSLSEGELPWGTEDKPSSSEDEWMKALREAAEHQCIGKPPCHEPVVGPWEWGGIVGKDEPEAIIDTIRTMDSEHDVPGVSQRARITDEAWGLVMGERGAAYGHPSSDFRAMGRISAAIIERWLESKGLTIQQRFDNGLGNVPAWETVPFPDIEPRIVALIQQAVKLSRESAKPKRDNRLDGIGYWLCADRIVEGY